MAGWNSAGIKTFTAGAAMEPYRRVKLDTDPTQVQYAGAGGTDSHVGFTQDSADSGKPVPVKLKNHPGTQKMCASGAITAGALVYGTTNGKITATSTSNGNPIGNALEAATADGDIIEVMPRTAESV